MPFKVQLSSLRAHTTYVAPELISMGTYVLDMQMQVELPSDSQAF